MVDQSSNLNCSTHFDSINFSNELGTRDFDIKQVVE